MAIPSTHSFVDHPPLVTALVAVAPTSPSGKLEVAVPAFGFARSLVLGWAPRASLPAVGDECLIAYDERGDPWVVSWVTAAPAAALLAALPASPFDGQSIYFQSAPMAEAGVTWHLRYRAAASTYKWEFVGGSALSTPVAGSLATASATYVASGGPALTLPLAGDYQIGFTTQLTNSNAKAYGLATVKLGAATASDNECAFLYSPEAGAEGTTGRTMTRTALAAAASVEMQYRQVGGGTASFSRRELWARPVRVG